MHLRHVPIGEKQNISLDFGDEPKAGERWGVQITINKPNGEAVAHYLTYKFSKPLTLPKPSTKLKKG